MSICGFSFGKNLVTLDYPIVEAIQSVLPVCDRFVFALGRSDDDTEQIVRSIDPKIEIVPTEWSDTAVDGQVLAEEANKAMAAAEATGATWGFYIQADEVVHEDDLSIVQAACARWSDEPHVKALLFKYLHFVLDYRTTDPWMYHKASRIVRLDRSCRIFGDACGPGFKEPTPDVLKVNDGYLDKRHLGGPVQWCRSPGGGPAARVFHYGWVKTRDKIDEKLAVVEKLWWGTLDEAEKQRRKHNKFGRFFDRYPYLKNFTGTHPRVMADRIAEHPPYDQRRNRWLNPQFYAEVLRHGFHG